MRISSHSEAPRRLHSAMRRAWVLTVVVALLLVPVGTSLASPLPSPRASEMTERTAEYAVKAGFLYHFTRYVRWPENAFKEKGSPLVVAVLAQNSFVRVLDEALKNKRYGDRAVDVEGVESLDALAPCHVLFVPASEESHLARIRELYANKPVLIVAESVAAAQQGAQVGFYTENSKVRFAINTEAAKQARLEISSELLKLAKLIEKISEANL